MASQRVPNPVALLELLIVFSTNKVACRNTFRSHSGSAADSPGRISRMDIAPDTKQREHYHVCSEDHHNTGCSVDTASLPHLGPLEARETVALAGHVVTHRAVVTVAPPLAVHVVGASGAGVSADLALVTQVL